MHAFPTFAFFVLALFLAPDRRAGAAASPALPLRLNCGGGDVVEHGSGRKWLSDKPYAVQGRKYRFPGASKIHTKTKAAPDPAPRDVYGTARRDGIGYHFTGLPDDRYLVRLHFVDMKPRARRQMEFWFEGHRLVRNLDVQKAAGGTGKAFVLEVVVEVSDGNGLEIQGSKGRGDDCYVCGIEILTAPVGAVATAPSGPEDNTPANLAAMIREFAGGPTRLVWTRQTDHGDFYAKGASGQLFVFDTETGGERCLLPEMRSYAKPMIADDGWQVVFTDSLAKACFTVPWSGGAPRKVADGYAADVWRDRQTGRQWVYVRTGWRDTGAPVVRVRLDDAKVREPVWSALPTGQAMACDLQISEDGTQAVGGFPWPQCGLADLKNGDFTPIGNGCWPSIGPGEMPRFFHFLGQHTAIRLFDEAGAAPRQISLATIPGWAGHKLYHPRWSNHPRLITATAPQWMPETELYIGRFDRAFAKIEAWQRVTFNHHADFFGDLWFAHGATAGGGYSIPRDAGQRAKAPPPPPMPDASDVIYRWDNQSAKNTIVDAAGKVTRVATTAFKGRARSNAWLGADLRSGHLIADSVSAAAVAGALAKGETLTVLLSLRANSAGNEGVLMRAGGGDGGAIEIVQSATGLRAVSRDGDGRLRSEATLGAIVPGAWERWAVHIGPREIAAWKNGVATVGRAAFDIPGDMGEMLTFGARADGSGPLSATLEALRIHRAPLDAGRIATDAEEAAAAWSQRKAPARTRVEAELVEASEPEDLAKLAPYTRSLAENLYRVTRVIEGGPLEGEIIVLQWIIMDSQHLRDTPEAGTRSVLELESVDTHPELAGEHRSTDLFQPELPVFYDVDS